MQRRHGLGLALVAVCASALGATAASQEGAQSWSFQFRAGEVEKYRTYIRLSGKQADCSGDLLLTLKSGSRHEIRQVTPEGAATYDQIDEATTVALGGKPLEAKPAEKKPVNVTFSKTGLMLRRENPQADPFARDEKAIPLLQSMPIPPRPVRVGEAWKTELPNPLVRGKTVTVTSTLLGQETVLGVPCVKVGLEMSFPTTFGATEEETVHASIVYHVDPKAGRLVRSSMLIRNPLLPFPVKNGEARVLISRIIPGANESNDPEGERLFGAP